MTTIHYLDFNLQIERAEQGCRAQIVASTTGWGSLLDDCFLIVNGGVNEY